MTPYPHADEHLGPGRRVQLPRVPRLYAPSCTAYVVARCNKREFYFKTPEDFAVVLKPRRVKPSADPAGGF